MTSNFVNSFKKFFKNIFKIILSMFSYFRKNKKVSPEMDILQEDKLLKNTLKEDYRNTMIKLVKQYQPNLYLNDKERFLPCSFEYMFSHMKLEGTKMVLKDPLIKPNEKRSWFSGDINNAPFYIYSSINEELKTLTLKYYILYAYNHGKYILLLNREIGNHVSDLEHCDLTFDISGDKIIPIRAGNYFHSHKEEYDWHGKIFSFYIALGSHGVYRTKSKNYYDDRLKPLNVFDDTKNCTTLFSPKKFIIFDQNNYSGISNVAFDETGKDISLELPEYNLTNWVSQLTGFGSIGKTGGVKIPFIKITLFENSGSIRNPSLNF